MPFIHHSGTYTYRFCPGNTTSLSQPRKCGIHLGLTGDVQCQGFHLTQEKGCWLLKSSKDHSLTPKIIPEETNFLNTRYISAKIGKINPLIVKMTLQILKRVNPLPHLSENCWQTNINGPFSVFRDGCVSGILHGCTLYRKRKLKAKHIYSTHRCKS